jgi:hypothetical protein
MTESGHAASFGIDIIIMASAGGVELALKNDDRRAAERAASFLMGAGWDAESDGIRRLARLTFTNPFTSGIKTAPGAISEGRFY